MAGPADKAGTILVVDDEPMILELLRTTLRAEGYDVIAAKDGEGCLEKLDMENRPDVIILDVGMPGMDGLEACRRIRADYPDLDAPIVFLTARKERRDVEEAIAAGGNDFIVKPFQTDTVVKRVRHWLEEKRRSG